MISPYVRRLRLGAEVRALRAEADLTADQLGKRIGRSRADISRLENGHVVDQADVISILDILGVDGDRWTQVVTIAREAGEKGWWESHKAMGDRQAIYANLEAGAGRVRASPHGRGRAPRADGRHRRGCTRGTCRTSANAASASRTNV